MRRLLYSSLLVAGMIASVTLAVTAEGPQDQGEAVAVIESIRYEVSTQEAFSECIADAENSTEDTIQRLDKTNHWSCDWDIDDSVLLAKIAMAEAEGESTEGKALVICTVLNRVNSPDYPGTIEEVIFQHNINSAGNMVWQFSSVIEGGRWYTTEPSEDCYKALFMVMDGWDESQGALFFENGKGDTWHKRNLEFLFEEGNHQFYK